MSKRKNSFIGFGGIFNDMNGNGTKEILRQSSRATCGTFEREVVVPAQEVSSTIRKLRDGGFRIVGTSIGNSPTKKIWFVKRGLGMI